jgi:flagellar biosynthesis protein
MDKQVMAAALAYRAGAGAPTVSAKGRGKVAEEIIRRAKESGVFVHESPELLSLLMQVDLDQQIPSDLYRVVAELLAWIYRIEQLLPDIVKNPSNVVK